MKTTEQLIEDALEERDLVSVGSFTTNRAAKELFDQTPSVFQKLAERLTVNDENVLGLPGAPLVLGNFLAIGNREAPQMMGEILKSMEPDMLAITLSHGILGIGRDPVSPILSDLIESFETHEHRKVSRWARKFREETTKMKNLLKGKRLI